MQNSFIYICVLYLTLFLLTLIGRYEFFFYTTEEKFYIFVIYLKYPITLPLFFYIEKKNPPSQYLTLDTRVVVSTPIHSCRVLGVCFFFQKHKSKNTQTIAFTQLRRKIF